MVNQDNNKQNSVYSQYDSQLLVDHRNISYKKQNLQPYTEVDYFTLTSFRAKTTRFAFEMT